jgi:hypothetical protein
MRVNFTGPWSKRRQLACLSYSQIFSSVSRASVRHHNTNLPSSYVQFLRLQAPNLCSRWNTISLIPKISNFCNRRPVYTVRSLLKAQITLSEIDYCMSLSQMAVRLSAARAVFALPPGRFQVLIYVRGWVNSRAIMGLEALGKLKFKTVKEVQDRLCGLVDRVLGYRSGGPGSIPGTTRKKNSSGSGTGSTQPREYNWGATW